MEGTTEAVQSTSHQHPRKRKIYPSDSIQYYNKKLPDGFSSHVRIPLQLVPSWIKVRDHIKGNNADVFRWLFARCQTAIESLELLPDLESVDAHQSHDTMDSQVDHPMEESLEDLDADPEVRGALQEPDSDDDWLNTRIEMEQDAPPRGANHIDIQVDEDPIDATDDDSNCEGDSIDNQEENHSKVANRRTHLAQKPGIPWTHVKSSALNYGFVARSKLVEFFDNFRVMCPAVDCSEFMHFVRISGFLMCYIVCLICNAGHKYPWTTGEMEYDRGSPKIVPRLFNAVLLGGMTYTHLSEICRALGLYTPSKQHFYRFQSGRGRKIGWTKAVTQSWKKKKDDLQEQFARKTDGIVVMLDARFDSSRSGYHGTAHILDYETGMVLEMITRTRVECGNSWKIEDIVIAEGLDALKAKGVRILEVVHDDKASVDALLNQREIESSKDLWHKAKKLMEKFKVEIVQLKKRCPDQIDESCDAEDVGKFTVDTLKKFLDSKQVKYVLKDKKPALVQKVLAFLGKDTQEEEEGPSAVSSDLLYPEFDVGDLAYRFKGWFYICCQNAAQRKDTTTGLLMSDISNCANHWAGDHSLCRLLDPKRKCVSENWPATNRHFEKDGPAYCALEKWLEKWIRHSKMKCYLKGRENYLSETFHSLILKYATKKTHFQESMHARLASSAMDWNENRSREVLKIRMRRNTETVVRRRPKKSRVLSEKKEHRKDEVTSLVFG